MFAICEMLQKHFIIFIKKSVSPLQCGMIHFLVLESCLHNVSTTLTPSLTASNDSAHWGVLINKARK